MCCQAATYWAGVPANCDFLFPSISQNQRMRTGLPRAFVAFARSLIMSSSRPAAMSAVWTFLPFQLIIGIRPLCRSHRSTSVGNGWSQG